MDKKKFKDTFYERGFCGRIFTKFFESIVIKVSLSKKYFKNS